MKRAVVFSAVLVATLVLVALTFATASANGGSGPVVTAPRVDFYKTVSHVAPQVGEVLTFTLRFAIVEGHYVPLRVQVADPNPAPGYLEILAPTITGGAWYSPTIDGVVWEGMVIPGDEPLEVAFQVRVLGVPDGAPAAGYEVVNKATMADLNVPGSLPEQTAEATVRLGGPRVFLPMVAQDSGR